VPFGHDYADCAETIIASMVLAKLKPILKATVIKKIGQILNTIWKFLRALVFSCKALH